MSHSLHSKSPSKVIYASTKCNTENGCLDWSIERYNLLDKEVGMQVNSPEFTVGGHKWFAALYPNGEDEMSKDFVSCFLILVGTKEKEVRAHISFLFNGLRQKLFRESCNTFNIPKTNNWGWDNLDLTPVIEDLEDDTMQIRIDIEVISGWTSSTSPVPGQTISHKCSLYDDFTKLLNGGFHSDVTLVVNESRIRAHKAILSIRSPVFKSMFECGMQESTKGVVNISDIEPTVFMELLRYMYCGKCDEKVLNDKVDDILAVADKYDVQGLKTLCSELLLSRTTVANASEMLRLADMHHALDLKAHAVSFIAKYFMEVFATDDFKDLCLRVPHLIAEVHEAVSQAAEAHMPVKNRDREKDSKEATNTNSKRKRKHE